MKVYVMTQSNNTDGFFFPFLNSFPKSVKEYPYFYGKKERDMLKNSEFLKALDGRLGETKKKFEIVTSKYPELKKYDFKDWMKATVLVESRFFNQDINGKKEEIMVPVSDLFNHNTSQSASWRYNNKAKKFEIFANSDIKEGGEIVLNYGEYKSNAKLLLEYGFTVTGFNHSGFEILYHPPKGVVENPHGLSLALKISITEASIFSSLPTYRRLAQNITKNSTNFKQPLSIGNELSAINLLMKVLEEKVTKYPSTLKHDLARLKNKGIKENEKNIRNVLIEEKSAFSNSLDKVKIIKNFLENYSSDDINAIKTSLFQNDKLVEKYFYSLAKGLKLGVRFEK